MFFGVPSMRTPWTCLLNSDTSLNVNANSKPVIRFNRVHKEHPHIGIFHETFDAPAGAWENI